MSRQRGLGSLADLAKILEDASNPESELREDRKEAKPKPAPTRKASAPKQVRALDPKRKLWYEKRLREQSEAAKASSAPAGDPAQPPHTPSLTRAAATRVGGSLLESLANARELKPKNDGTKGRAEAWRRKPGDPIF
jgi:IS5 family transposase